MRNKNLRAILLSLILLFTMLLTTGCSGSGAVVKVALRGLEQAIQSGWKALQEPSQQLGDKAAGELGSEAAKQLGSEAAKQLEQAIQPGPSRRHRSRSRQSNRASRRYRS